MSAKQSLSEQINTLGELVSNLSHKTSFKVKLSLYKAGKKLKRLVCPRPEDKYKAPSSDQDYTT